MEQMKQTVQIGHVQMAFGNVLIIYNVLMRAMFAI